MVGAASGFSNGVVCANNVCFNGTRSAQMTVDGQIIVGKAGFPPQVSSLTPSTGIGVINGPGSITLANQGMISPYIVGSNGNYTTIQAAINAAHAAGTGTVYVYPGTYNENLTLYSGVDVCGAVALGDTGILVLNGTHTPPLAGSCTIRNFTLSSATNIFSSAAAGTATLIVIDCLVSVTNGYTFNLPNWTGTFIMFNVGQGGTNNGEINNTAGATVFYTNVSAGKGTVNTCHISGTFVLYNVIMQCPVSFEDAASGNANGGCWFFQTINVINTASIDIANSFIATGINAAINTTSAAATSVTLSNVTIESSAANVITGTGSVQYSSVSYTDGTSTAGTITKDFTTRFETGVLKLNDADNGYLIATNGVVSTGGGVVNQQQIFYVGKHGNNANDGLSIGNAKLTFTAAITAASALTPSAINRFVVWCSDDGIYAENIVVPSFVDIFAPNTTLTGTITVDDNCNIKFFTQNAATGTTAITKPAGTVYSNVEIDIINCAGTANGCTLSTGFLNLTWKELYVVDGYAIGDISVGLGHIHIKGGDIYISGTGIGLIRANTGTTVGHIDHILDHGGGTGSAIIVYDGTIDVNVNKIEVTNAYNVQGATSVLNLFCNEILGTQLCSLGGKANVWVPPAYPINQAGMTNGQLVIGSTGNTPAVSTLTSGAGILVTNAAGSITITNTGASGGSGMVTRQVFTSSGTYTPTSGMIYCDIEVIGGGGGGGGCAGTSGSEVSSAAGGGAGGYAKGIFAAATIGASQTVTINNGGAGGAAGNNAGANGGDVSVGALISSTGGLGGAGSAAAASVYLNGTIGGVGTGGSFQSRGGPGGGAFSFTDGISLAIGGAGGNSVVGGGAPSTANAAGSNSSSAGGGGSGASRPNSGAAAAGGNGMNGTVIITEYISISGANALTYQEITAATKTIVVNFEYGANRGGGVAFALPATAAVGTRFAITGIAGLWSLTQAANQYVLVGDTTTSVGVGGSITATDAGDSIVCTCIVADLGWRVTNMIGNPTIA